MTMEPIRKSVLAILFALFIWQPLSAQQHVADQATLDQVAADYVRQKGDDREAIRRVLEIQEVREIAAGAGFDLKRAETAVATLDDAEVGLIAAQARAVNDSLAGGGSITISTTVIIIGLLVLILLIVAI
jgi:acetyl-CoA carboxylase carboxyltransferase component